MPNIKSYIVDSFTNQAFKGNPAGVCLLDPDLSKEQMQSVANELGLSETAFLNKQSDHKYDIRFFSPKTEIPLCGHATLAAGKVIFQNNNSSSRLHFTNVQGIDLFVSKEDQLISMEFPAYDIIPARISDKMLNALNLKDINNSFYNRETDMLGIEIADSAVLEQLKPNFDALLESHQDISGVVVTALSNKHDFDFESRYFCPWSVADEDPVTGASHTFLSKYWGAKLGKNNLKAFQCSKRTGFMNLELMENNKLKIKSEAQIIMEGVFYVQ